MYEARVLPGFRTMITSARRQGLVHFKREQRLLSDISAKKGIIIFVSGEVPGGSLAVQLSFGPSS